MAELAAEMPETRLVYVADRESDIRELMVRARDLGTPADWLLRSQHNRALPEGGRLWAKVLASPPLGEIRFTLPGGRGRTAREVRQALYAERVSLSDGRRGTFEVTCLVAREIGAPPGVKPIEWRLLTNRTAETLEAVVELIDWYRARWEIEIDQPCCLRKAVTRTCKEMLAHQYVGGWPSRVVPCGVRAGVRIPAHRPTPASGCARPGGPGGHAPSPCRSS